MCDYSLTVAESRPAMEGERLVIHRFNNGVHGFVSQIELCGANGAEGGWWRKVLDWFSLGRDLCAICLQPGTKLVLRDVPDSLRSRLQLDCEEEVTFTQSGSPYWYRDAIRFREGTEILVQELPAGLVVDVLSMDATPPYGEMHETVPDEASFARPA